MKALMKAKPEKGIWLTTEAPIPKPGPNDVLIQIKKTAICGTDVHIYNWDPWSQKNIPVPLITGHEFVGSIVEIGSEVKGFSVGERISGEGHITCGYCRNCHAGRRHLCHNVIGLGINRAGCFAEYLALPAGNAYKIPPAIPDNVAAILDPLGNAAHTALSFDCIGEDVLITGAGPIGIMAARICRHIGARHVVITDINPNRLKLAEKMGATRTVNVTQESLSNVMTELNMSEGFDVGLEMSGNGSAIETMLSCMNHGGRVALLGIPPNNISLDWNDIIFKGLHLKGIYGREMFETWYKTVSMLTSGLDISDIITHEFPVDDFEVAFQTMISGNSGKVILNWENK